MDWTECPVIEVVPGRMSGEPVLRHSRVRPQDLLNNIEQTPDWLADAFGVPVADVLDVLSFYRSLSSLGCQLSSDLKHPTLKETIG